MTGRQGKDGKWLVRLEKHLHEVAGDDNLIDLDEFINALNVKESFFAERFFELNDKDQSGSISLEELIVALRLLVNGTEQQKLHFLFQVYDVDGSGFIDVDELRTVLRSCTDECALTLPEETLTELTEILFADADVDGDGEVSFEELSEQLQRYPGITSNLSFCAAEWLNPKKKKPKSQSRCSYHALRNNFSVIIFWIVFVIINVGLAAWGAYEGYRSVNDERHPAAIIIARSAGLIYQVENVNGTTAAWIRNVLVRPFPGLGLVEGSCIITDFLTLHIRCVGHWTKRLYNVVRERQLALLEDEPGFGEIDKEHDTPLEVIVEVSSTKSTSAVESNSQQSTTSDIPIDNNGRRSSKTYNKRRRTARGATNLGFVPELPNGDKDGTKTVTEGKPYNTGQNDDESLAQKVNPTQLSLPRKADHPSASQGDCQPMPHKELGEISMTLAVNGNSFKMKSLNSRQSIDVQEAPRGNTTKRQSLRVRQSLAVRERRSVGGKPNDDVNRKMSLVTLRRNGARHSLDLSKDLGGTPHTGLEVILDGPYGAPAQHIMEAEHAVLIGAGIGITPFASILQSIHERYKAAKKQCPNCNHTWVTDTSSILKTKKVDFVWINRDQRSFEWFISLISTIELEQAEIPAADRFLDIHLYMTSALLPSDMKAIGLHVALDLIHQKKNRDTITGLKTRTQAGRPDWDEVFQNLKQQHKGKITVFFCGSPALGKILSTKCLQYHMEFRKENF
ncbi:NADPH oxidase 5-like [Strongylocentrotus purpuratus]|uniref:EF-hand domain-containing protein n=1 Tax=Strongylocentrotus purpuratus TaxID=7668 RepID=A0A7M7P5Z2_STRPU|nr:NADPH oxidase 5-like [Strongylocentrotus purpuratus]